MPASTRSWELELGSPRRCADAAPPSESATYSKRAVGARRKVIGALVADRLRERLQLAGDLHDGRHGSFPAASDGRPRAESLARALPQRVKGRILTEVERPLAGVRDETST